MFKISHSNLEVPASNLQHTAIFPVDETVWFYNMSDFSCLVAVMNLRSRTVWQRLSTMVIAFGR